ncbi:GATOR complex protein NPRL2 [Strongylocentrotus purpuratus]|uniref:Nitrogen permease regulator 2-like protein n=1 Tax=Strongylocentrotus purpuratus TaxID=7668 RepID=A0A7M7SSJ7_STRPU|nr:GATOR complex protein NPRL2 [Strongylocentrotus purpuratus]
MAAFPVGKLKCIFFSEFHPQAGPKITYQVPDDYISRELFDIFSVYIIPKPELQDKLITVNVKQGKVIGWPSCIRDDKYARNEYLFNVCFVCDSTTDVSSYETLVKKLSAYFTTLELECAFLSNEETKCRVPDILEKLLSHLNEFGKCSVPINDSNTIHLKIVPPTKEPQSVLEHHVPMFLCSKEHYENNQWDLTTQQILQYIDGVNHVQRIAVEADVDLNLVKICLQNLLYYGVITIVPIFQYSNVYMVQPSINTLMENTQLQRECIEYVTLPGHNPPTLRSVMLLYSSLCPGMTVRDLCMRHNPRALNICERHLIQFGVVKGLIRRLHKYPVKLQTADGQHNGQHNAGRNLDRWMQGKLNFDEICCGTGMSHKDLDEQVEKDVDVSVCWK